MDIIIFSSACGLAIATGYLLGLARGKAKGKTAADDTARKLHEAEMDLTSLRTEYEAFKKSSAEMMNTRLEAQKQLYDDLAKAGEKRMEETLARMTSQLRESADTMLRQRQEEFASASAGSIERIVTPLKERIGEMKRAMDENARSQTDISATMRTSIEHLMTISGETRKSAEELAKVFRHQGKVQGDWGERVLGELLESQGLTEGIHFDVQPQITDEKGQAIVSRDGSRMRPDVILHLDRDREMVIDAKVSMTAYMDYVNAETAEERDRCLRAHVASIEKHVEELARKDYSSYIKAPKVSVDYVIMFMPNSAALWTALNARPDLWRKAMERNVYIADEQTLYAALRIIDMTWRQIAQARNHEKVYQLAGEMLDRVGQFERKYEAIGDALDKARRMYDEGSRKLDEKGQSIRQTCAKLLKLGAVNSSRNPVSRISQMDAEDGD